MLKFNTKETKIWFTSDLHYWHSNMCFADSIWDDKEKSTRKFTSTKEMSRHLVAQLNKYVGQDDVLFFLGDWSFGGIENIWNLRKQLICKNIHFIFGNHDHHVVNNVILPNCKRHHPYSWDIIEGKPIGGEYPDYVEAQSIFTSAQHYLEIQIDKQLVCMMHYPIDSWNRKHLHFHGHTHGNFTNKKNRFDVGIDNAFKLYGEYRPFSWEELLKIKDEVRLNDRYSY